jgi:dipeptidyl aminopeptidase/acylaminoacyl peptidase
MKTLVGASLLAFLSVALPCLARAQETLEGEWSGIWTRAGDTLAVDITFRNVDGGWSGTFDSERLRVVGIPFTEVTYDSPRVLMRIVGDATTMVFEAEVVGDSLTGILREDSAAGTIRLLKNMTPRPEVHEEEVEFESDTVRLAGSLILPAGPGPHPAVVFLQGSGPEGRWASRYLAVRLARAGYAALIYDKRGVGGSGGDWRSAGFDDLANDARSGVRYLLQREEIDSRRIGIHGHSQGGTIAPLVAEPGPTVAFVIASAAAGLPMDEVEIYSVMNSLGGTDDPLAREFVRELVAVAYHGASRVRFDSLAVVARTRPWFFEPPSPDNAYWAFSRRIAEYDPLEHWRRVTVPVLLLYGEADQRVPPGPSAERIVTALAEGGNENVTVRIFPEADHTYRLSGQGWPRTVAGYPDVIVEWLDSLAPEAEDGTLESGAARRER